MTLWFCSVSEGDAENEGGSRCAADCEADCVV